MKLLDSIMSLIIKADIVRQIFNDYSYGYI